jgi:16S rRNA (uracil1498-N3)-methyltransferase
VEEVSDQQLSGWVAVTNQIIPLYAMHRFFVPPEWIDHERVVITGSQAYQIKEVLRLKVGDRITLLDNTGLEYKVSLLDIKTASVTGEVIERSRCQNDPGLEIVLHQAMLKGNKFDLALQKCTEIGVAGFVPILCERCVAGAPSLARISRWHRIILEAAEQCKGGKAPTLYPTLEFQSACERVSGFSLLPWEEEKSTGIKAAINGARGARRVNIFIGPEGGFTKGEAEFARSKGITPVTLGKRILRAETAGLVATVAILYERDELGGANLT